MILLWMVIQPSSQTNPFNRIKGFRAEMEKMYLSNPPLPHFIHGETETRPTTTTKR